MHMHHHHGHDDDHDHDHDMPPGQKQERYDASKRVTLIGAVLNVLLTVGKIGAGIVGNSAAMIADGIHSASDLVSDTVVLISMKLAHRDADEDHPYGHGKYEALAALFVAVALLVVALGIVMDSVGRLTDPDLSPPGTVALIAAFISVVAKEIMFHYTMAVGKKYDAKAIIANAWHQRSDAISSVAALAGIGAAMYGFPIMDPLAAVVVAFILGKVGVEVFMDALKELTDSIEAIDDEVRTQINQLVHDVPEVLDAHALHARRMGPDVFVDAHVVVHAYLSVSEGHQVADKVRAILKEKIHSITDVMVHVDTIDDLAMENRLPMYPFRDAFQPLVDDQMAKEGNAFAAIRDLVVHYTPNGVVMDLQLTAKDGVSQADLQAASDRLAAGIVESNKDICTVQVALHLTEKGHLTNRLLDRSS